MTFSQKTLEYIHPGDTVLDLGAGNGWFSEQCIAREAIVTAVDVKPPAVLHQNITWHTTDVQEYVDRWSKTEKFHLIYSRNLIQFLDTAWVQEKLFPALLQHLKPGGIIAIQTFYQDPEPPFEHPLASLFTVKDLVAMITPLRTLLTEEFSHQSPDMKGVLRTFFVTNVIAQQ